MKNSQLLPSEQPASILHSVKKLFEEDAPSSMDGMYEAHRQLQACMTEEDPNIAFERAHEIVDKGLHEWLWNLRKTAEGIVTTLAEIAVANPKWITADPASWACSRTKDFLDDFLDGWGSPPTPRILIWLRQACDGPGPLDFDRYESGRPEPWCAPVWVGQARNWPDDPRELDERITPERTERLLSTKRLIFDSSLDYGLEKAKHAARISLAKKPTLWVPLKSSPRMKLEAELSPSSVRAQQKVLFVRLNGKIIADPKFSDIALLNTYESIKDTLAQIRVCILAEKGTSVSEGLRTAFGRTELGKAATDKNWKEWIRMFAEQGAAPGNAALVFLEDATGQNRDTIKKRCSNARRTSLKAMVIEK